MIVPLLALQLLSVPAGLDALIPAPDANPITPAKAALGRKLFFDKSLSRDRTVSCGTCHEPERAFTDAKPLAVGIEGRKGTRRTPTIINRAYGRVFFWDGRSPSLEDQVLKPISNPDEMDLSIEDAERRSGLTRDVMAHALASYVRTILAGASRYDRYLNGDRDALSPDETAGLRLFRGKANCGSCHVGTNLTDERLHNTGAGAEDKAFKTPTLREVARRAPYMHDGSLATLEDVIEHYDKGGTRGRALDAEMQPLSLTAAEKRQLAAFLRALGGVVKDGYDDANTAAPR